jgi:fatty-acyl-CoA synthase
MAALVVADPVTFDARAFYAHVVSALPSYAIPVFLRLQVEAEVTGTFKLRKVELQREGWDPAKLEDPLFVRDDAARAYVPLDAQLHRAVAAGEVRL